MLDEIEFGRLIRYDYHIPAECPDRYCFCGERLDILDQSDPNYVVNIVKDLIPELREQVSDGGFYIADAIELALENAFSRGNCLDTHLPVSVKVFSGRKGHVIRIRDSGMGFNYRKKIKQMRSKEYGYAKNFGQGLLALDEPGFEASYENRGSTLNIMIPNPCPEA